MPTKKTRREDYSKYEIDTLTSAYRLAYRKGIELDSQIGVEELEEITEELLCRSSGEIFRGLDCLQGRRRVYEEKGMSQQALVYKEIIDHFYQNVFLEHEDCEISID